MHPGTSPSREYFVNDAAVVHTLPLFYDRLNQVINHPRSSIADITKIIAEDAGFSSQILKLANSPLFGYCAEIDSVATAITIIGTQQIRDMSLALSVMGSFGGIPEELVNMTSFWKHSITTAIVARVLATCRREANVERFFLAGMLHDIGQLIMCIRAPELMNGLIGTCRQSGDGLHSLQRSQLGYDHGEVGGELLKQWKIPAVIVEPVTFHHTPCAAQLYPMETSLLHVADVISHALQVGSGGELFVPAMEEQSWERLAIPVSMMPTILEQSDIQLKETMAVLLTS